MPEISRPTLGVNWEKEPLPQVGAILHYDSALPRKDEEIRKGSKYWMLDGSCSLVGPRHCLGVMHILWKRGTKAVFLPGEGIFLFEKIEDEVEGRWKGDYLALIPLDKGVLHTKPLPWKRIVKKRGTYARIAGYGRWVAGGESLADGIQRGARIDLARWHDDHLDIDWWVQENRSLSLGRNNSGGPLLWGRGPRDFEVIGVSREREKHKQREKQIASWIGTDRNGWLTKRLGTAGTVEEGFDPAWRELTIRAISRSGNNPPGTVETVEVPPGARTARATLSATDGLRLQMGLTQTENPAQLLDRLAGDDTASGRFLVRPIESDDLELNGSGELTVVVTPVRVAPEKATDVEAQICVRFA